MHSVIWFKKLTESARLPTQATSNSAGFDLYSCEDAILKSGERKLIGLGFATEIPGNHYVAIVPRSGLAVKQGVSIVNTPGTIDADYRGEWKVCLINLGNELVHIRKGDRIAQGIMSRYEKVKFEEVESLGETQRSSGGFGSTGT